MSLISMNKYKRIFIIAGESSGDKHAASYVNEQLNKDSQITFDAFGQKELKKTAANVIYDTEKIAVVGIIEVISKYKEILNALNTAKKYINETRPDLIILVDYVEFNLKVARYAKSLGIKVVFYIAPQLWAWRENRAKKLVENINHLGVIFPFEESFFKKYTNNVSYVGHPLFHNKKLLNSVKDYQDRTFDLGIFPGSRESEIKNNIHVMMDCLQKNKNENIVIFYANNTALNTLKTLLPNDYHSMLISGDDYDQVSNCKKALCASGTITLELAILEIPMVIMYKLSYISYFVMKTLVKLKFIGLVNLVLGEEIGAEPVVKEYIQPSYSDQIDIMVELNKIDNDITYRQEVIKKYQEIKNKLTIKPTYTLSDIVDKLS